jgi:hypothetical protein
MYKYQIRHIHEGSEKFGPWEDWVEGDNYPALTGFLGVGAWDVIALRSTNSQKFVAEYRINPLFKEIQ